MAFNAASRPTAPTAAHRNAVRTPPTDDNAAPIEKMALLAASCKRQMETTELAMVNRWEHLYRRTRSAFIDLEHFCKAAKKPVSEALDDMSSVSQCYDQDLINIQETYFTIAVAMVALSIGGILGNRWSELAWAPQLGIARALLAIVLQLVRIWIGSSASVAELAVREHRSQLYLELLATGFSMGNLFNYSLLIIVPRVLCPLVFALMVNNYSVGTPSSRPLLYLLVIGCCLPLALFPAFLAGQLFSIRTPTLVMLALSIHHCLLFVHFQLYYYGLYTLRERWQNEPMKEEEDKRKTDNDATAADAHQQHKEWTMEGVNRWMRNAELIYVLCSLLLDVPIGVLQGCFFACC